MATEKRLIDGNARIEEIRKAYCTNCDNYDGVRCRSCWVDDGIGFLEDAPTVDAVEVVHGRWNRVEADLGGGIKTHRFACSECGFLKNTLIGNYCPNCGAKMDGGNEDG